MHFPPARAVESWDAQGEYVYEDKDESDWHSAYASDEQQRSCTPVGLEVPPGVICLRQHKRAHNLEEQAHVRPKQEAQKDPLECD